MSSSWGLVRFPGGEVLAGLYNGTADLFKPGLVTLDDWDGSWDVLEARQHDIDSWDATDEQKATAVDVDVYADHGGGTHWRGRASLKHRQLFAPFHYGNMDVSYTKTVYVPYETGTPDWVSHLDLEHRWNS